jgi:hypothetical protein
MRTGRNRNNKTRRPQRSAAQSAGRSERWTPNTTRPEPQISHNAQTNYDRYLALAQAEAQSGNMIAAENYYQHAEHYFRVISSNRAAT